jgi:hypothetical protein
LGSKTSRTKLFNSVKPVEYSGRKEGKTPKNPKEFLLKNAILPGRKFKEGQLMQGNSSLQNNGETFTEFKGKPLKNREHPNILNLSNMKAKVGKKVIKIRKKGNVKRKAKVKDFRAEIKPKPKTSRDKKDSKVFVFEG